MSTTQIPEIQATVRERLGTRYAARLREEGQLPVVVYGHKKAPLHVSVDFKQLNDLLHDNVHLLKITTDQGTTEACLIKDVQWNHLSSRIIHADLARVDLTEKVTVEVVLEFTGNAVGLKEAGAILEHPVNSIEVECLATNIPQTIVVNVEALEAGQSLSVSNLTLPQGVVAKTEGDTVVASVQVQAEVVEEEATEGGDEPEVIGRPAKEDGEAGDE